MAKILSVKTARRRSQNDAEDITVNRAAIKNAITALEALIRTQRLLT